MVSIFDLETAVNVGEGYNMIFLLYHMLFPNDVSGKKTLDT